MLTISITAGSIKAGLLLIAILILPVTAEPLRLIVATNTEYSSVSLQHADNAAAQFLSHYASRVEPLGGALRKGGGSGLLRVELAKGIELQQAVNYYRQLPGVRFVEPDYILKKQHIPNDPQFNLQWHLGQVQGINAPAFWQQSTGEQQLVVAVVDTGVAYLHPDLQANLWRNPVETINGVDDDGNGYIDDIYGIDTANNTSDPADEDGHGSQIGGIIAATTNNTLGVAGVNWQLQVLHCKFLDETGTGFVSDAIACLDYLLDLKQRHNINIVASNNSWGGAGQSQALYEAIARHQQAGILFIASAGNSGSQSLLYPAAYDLANIISVAAHDQAQDKATFSNYGREWVDVTAPGAAIVTTDLDDGYTSVSGTSMAAPVVSGVVALLKAAEPALGWQALRARLLLTGKVSTDPLIRDYTSSGKLLLASSVGRGLPADTGVLQCQSQPARRISPATAIVYLPAGSMLDIRVLSIDCNGNAIQPQVTAENSAQSILLTERDNVEDGIFTGQWQFSGDATELIFADSVVSVLPRNDDYCTGLTNLMVPLNQCNALVQLYYETVGQSWLNNQGWLEPEVAVCSWAGVSCSNGQVRALDLSNNNLTGELPAALAGLTALTELDLSFNSLTGDFPAVLLQLRSLQQLSLWQNGFTGAIPAAISELRALSQLDLSFNNFSGALPASLGQLSSLQRVFVESNQLSGALPSALAALTDLQILWLADNNFSGTLPQNFIELTGLSAFSYQNTSLCPPQNLAFSSWLAGIATLERNSQCANSSPQVSTPATVTALAGAMVQLRATVTDSDNDFLRYRWLQLSGPTVTLSSATSLDASFTAPVVTSSTSLVFSFTADDGISQNSSNTTVQINPAGGAAVNPDNSSGGALSFGMLLLAALVAWRRQGLTGQRKHI
ncbi:S8 family peptidase [Arsukibacterium sp. UBA3155]|uniref:S8 family peptidase n=1 Tax=Arsukibacterium sp. UBA3155 TaxID=1946058 RepID=UPI0025C42FA5|nr:S8 family serine peptidase [Arsukibacterium sp. UBA3155]|tara:strand:- start:96845 stop:99547 length:2703 start_codon:yes stop_codon:yes gene_type:complete